MELTELINEATRLSNLADIDNTAGNHRAANVRLRKLLELLTNWLIVEAPTEPEKPEAEQPT